MKWLMLSLAACLTALLLACRQSNMAYQSLSVDEFENLITTDPNAQRLDVRTVAEYSEGHIAGSLNVNVLDEASFLEVAEDVLQKDKPVALYCRSGKRSKKAAEILSKQGYKVYELDKGFQAWKAASKKIEK